MDDFVPNCVFLGHRWFRTVWFGRRCKQKFLWSFRSADGKLHTLKLYRLVDMLTAHTLLNSYFVFKDGKYCSFWISILRLWNTYHAYFYYFMLEKFWKKITSIERNVKIVKTCFRSCVIECMKQLLEVFKTNPLLLVVCVSSSWWFYDSLILKKKNIDIRLFWLPKHLIFIILNYMHVYITSIRPMAHLHVFLFIINKKKQLFNIICIILPADSDICWNSKSIPTFVPRTSSG